MKLEFTSNDRQNPLQFRVYCWKASNITPGRSKSGCCEVSPHFQGTVMWNTFMGGSSQKVIHINTSVGVRGSKRYCRWKSKVSFRAIGRVLRMIVRVQNSSHRMTVLRRKLDDRLDAFGYHDATRYNLRRNLFINWPRIPLTVKI